MEYTMALTRPAGTLSHRMGEGRGEGSIGVGLAKLLGLRIASVRPIMSVTLPRWRGVRPGVPPAGQRPLGPPRTGPFAPSNGR